MGTEKKTKPVLGAVWGLLLGIGLSLLAVNFKVIELSLVPMIALVVVGVVLGVLWSIFGPAKAPKDELAPDPVRPAVDPTPQAPDPG